MKSLALILLGLSFSTLAFAEGVCSQPAAAILEYANKAYNVGAMAHEDVVNAEIQYQRSQLTCGEIDHAAFCSAVVPKVTELVQMAQLQYDVGVLTSTDLAQAQKNLEETKHSCE
jgi:hypothetical protein